MQWVNCSECGRIPEQVHLDDGCEGRATYLGTGIANLEAAKRYLKRKFNRGPLEPVQSRPGEFFFVTAYRGRGHAAFLLGPYVSHMTALANVPRARRLAREGGYDLGWLPVGTASSPRRFTTVLGR